MSFLSPNAVFNSCAIKPSSTLPLFLLIGYIASGSSRIAHLNCLALIEFIMSKPYIESIISVLSLSSD